MGKYASGLFMKILKDNDKIMFSDSLIWELRKAYRESDIFDMLNFLFKCGVLVKVDISKDEYKEAERLSGERRIPFADCLQAVQARNHKAMIVSQDKHITKGLSDIAKRARPQEIT